MPVLLALTATPLMIAAILADRYRRLGPLFLRRKLQVGAPVIYRKLESSTRPGRHACEVRPAEKGEFYYYLTKKYWRVEAIRPDGCIVTRSPFMEQFCLRPDDPNLRKANLIERLRYAARFPYLP